MKLVTLEDNMRGIGESIFDQRLREKREAEQRKKDAEDVARIRSSSASQTDPKAIRADVPHFSWMLNDDVLLDALGSQRTRVPGSSFGLIRPETKNTSGFGVFRTKHDQPIVIVTEEYAGANLNPVAGNLFSLGCFGTNPEVIDVPRGEGDGYIEEWLMPQIRNKVLPKLEQIENRGASSRVVVIKVKGRARTWKYLAELSLQYAELALNLAMDYAAPYASSILGVSASDFLQAKPFIRSLVKNGPVDVSALASAAVMVVPQDIRPSLDKAADFYQKAQSGQYLPAAKVLGIEVGQINNILNDFSSGVPDSVAKTAQGVYVMDTINQVRGSIRSGTAKQEIINNGTITQSTAIQNMLMSAIGTTTAAIPRAIEISGLTAMETKDLQTTNEWRGIWQIAHGLPTTPCSLDRLALRGLVERARDLSQKGFNQMNIPALVPADKRDCFADEVRAQTGMKTSGSSTGFSPTFLLGVAGVAGVAYFAMRK